VIKALCFGAVLWDIVDKKANLGGAVLNLAANLKKLGTDTYMYSCVGKDQYGLAGVEKIKALGINSGYIQIDETKSTGYAKIVFDENKIPSYHFCKDASHEYITVNDETISKINQEKFDLICYGTFCQQGAVSRTELKKLLKEGDFKIKFCDINLRQDVIDVDVIKDTLLFTDILKLNDEEVIRISEALYGEQMKEHEFVQKIQQEFKLKLICITKGSFGCSVYDENGNGCDVKAPSIKAVDTVGAGDAFSAGFLASLFQGKSLETCGKTGNILGSYVASHEGAIVEYSDELRNMLAE